MKLKEGINIKIRNGDYLLSNQSKEKLVKTNQVYLLEAIQKGINNDAILIKIIMQKEDINEISAECILAGFIIEYADFLADDTSHYMILD